MYDKYITICIHIYIIYLNVYTVVGPLAILWTDVASNPCAANSAVAASSNTSLWFVEDAAACSRCFIRFHPSRVLTIGQIIGQVSKAQNDKKCRSFIDFDYQYHILWHSFEV